MYLFLNSEVYLNQTIKLMYLCSNSKVYTKYIFKINAFLFKPTSKLEAYFLNVCIYLQTLKYT